MVSDIFIIDLANATFSDVNKITPSLLAKSLLVYKVKKQNKTCSAMTQRFWPTGSVFASTEGHPLRQQPILHFNIDEDVQSCGQTENFRTSEYT
jgi:predicted lipase